MDNVAPYFLRRVDIPTRYHSEAFNDGVGIAAILPLDQFHLRRAVVIQDHIIECQIALLTADHLPTNLFPHQPGGEFVLF